jgi:hypothetical protein
VIRSNGIIFSEFYTDIAEQGTTYFECPISFNSLTTTKKWEKAVELKCSHVKEKRHVRSVVHM